MENQTSLKETFTAIANFKLATVGGRKRAVAKEQKAYAQTALEVWDDIKALDNLRKGVIRNHQYAESQEFIELLVNRIRQIRTKMVFKDINGDVINEGDWVRDTTNDTPGQNVSRVMNSNDGLYFDSDGPVYLWEIDTDKWLEKVELQAGMDPGAPDGDHTAEVEVKVKPKKGTKNTTTSKRRGIPGVKPTRKVGDIHKNGKWVWTEYQPGRFDWRTIKK